MDITDLLVAGGPVAAVIGAAEAIKGYYSRKASRNGNGNGSHRCPPEIATQLERSANAIERAAEAIDRVHDNVMEVGAKVDVVKDRIEREVVETLKELKRSKT